MSRSTIEFNQKFDETWEEVSENNFVKSNFRFSFTHSVKTRNLLSLEKNSRKQLMVSFNGEYVAFTEFLQKRMVRVNFRNFHTVTGNMSIITRSTSLSLFNRDSEARGSTIHRFQVPLLKIC